MSAQAEHCSQQRCAYGRTRPSDTAFEVRERDRAQSIDWALVVWVLPSVTCSAMNRACLVRWEHGRAGQRALARVRVTQRKHERCHAIDFSR